MLQNSLRYFKGVGPKKQEAFNKLGVYSIKDLLYYFPFRYEDRTNFKKIKDLEVGEIALVKGKALAKHLKKIPYYFKAKRVRDIFEIAISDNTSVADCVWFNQGFLDDSLKVGDEIILYGKVTHEEGRFKFVSPQYELSAKADDTENDESLSPSLRSGIIQPSNFSDTKSEKLLASLNFGRIVGIYRLSAAFTQKFMRRIIFSALAEFRNDLPEGLPFYIRQQKFLPNIVKSLEEIHFPTSFEAAESSRERFIFEELFFSQILVYLRKAKQRLQQASSFKVNGALIDKIKENLNFTLTASQNEVLSQILKDIEKTYPMHRLLQGDVGCGKTVVSSFAVAVCIDSGFQAALMVPTEVLAYQHK